MGGYVWDDDLYVTQNENLRSFGGLAKIWTDPKASQQYYPFVYTTFWLEYQLWGLHPSGYHVVNLILHGLMSLTLWRTLIRLRVPFPGWVAAIFALHPVHVESVAWITERKNVLSGVFFILAIYVYARGASSHRTRSLRWDRRDTLILFLYVCALLSKTATCGLPVVLLVIDWWKRRRIDLAALVRVVPLLFVGGCFGGMTVYLEWTHVGAEQLALGLTWADRIIIAGRAICFYLGKLLWPSPLAFMYERWQVDASQPAQLIWPAAALALLAVLAVGTKRWGRGPLAAMLYFVVTLAPVLGFIDAYPFRYSFVADHFQYLASIGPIALITAIAGHIWGKCVAPGGPGLSQPVWLRHGLSSVVMLILAALVWERATVYIDPQTFWEDAVQKNPEAWAAHQNLGALLDEQGRTEDALSHFRTAIALAPDNVSLRVNLGIALFNLGRVDEALDQYHHAIESRPDSWLAHYNLGTALSTLGRTDEAIARFTEVLELKPDGVSAAFNLGAIFDEKGSADRAIEYYERVLHLDPAFVIARFRLARLLAQRGDDKSAVGHLQTILADHPNDTAARELLARLKRDRSDSAEPSALPGGSVPTSRDDPPW